MRRREFIAGLGSAAAWPVVGRAQKPRIPRIGCLVTGSLDSPETQVVLSAFLQGLRELGYVEGENILLEYREAHGRIERFSSLATELVRAEVELIIAANTPAGLAARQATTAVPIVVQVMGDPVRDGLVASLARPGGNITGLTFLGPELTAKRLQLLKDILPSITRVTILWHPGAYGQGTMDELLDTTRSAAEMLTLGLQMIEVRSPEELEGAFFKATTEHAEAVLVFPSPMLYTERRHVVDFALRDRLPLMAMDRVFAELGGLVSYGASITDLFRRSATFVDKILKGARPGDLPVEQPTEFQLVINLKTARALGVKVPPSLLARADEVIE
jgi:putative ABC transport system substrate-binding protein